MKVLHVIPSISERSGGPGQAIIPMCRALRELGVDVLLATTDAGMVGKGQEAKGQGYWKDVPTIFFPAQLGRSLKYSRPFAQWLDENVSEFDVVHIHAVFNHACVAAARACRKQGVPYIVRPLGTLDPWSMKQKSLRKKVSWHAGIKTMLINAAAIQYTTRGEQQAVEESLSLNHGVVVPLGVETKSIQKSAMGKPLSDQFPALQDCPYVLVLSRLHPKKALEVLLEAFLSLVKHAEFQDWRLVLAGEGPGDYVALLKKMVAEQAAGDFVVFPGWLNGETKAAALRDASLSALPSHHENFGLCVMESLACGVPVLISPHVNLAPEIEVASAGWIAEVNVAAIEQALAAALSSKDERLARGGNGKQLALNYAWPNIASQLRQVYSEIIPKVEEVIPKSDEAISAMVQHA